MDDADITALAEQLGLTCPIDDVVVWARRRTEDVLGAALDADLGALLEGRAAHEPVPTTTPRYVAQTETQPGLPRPVAIAVRLPLPPVPQRPDLAARSPGDSADDLEMLDEEDLELVEEFGDDGDADGDDRTPGESDGEPGDRDRHLGEGNGDPGDGDREVDDPGPAVSSPEWKRALADAQGE